MNSCMTFCNSRGFGRGVGVVGGWIRAIALVVVVLAGYSRAQAQCPAGWLPGQGLPGVNSDINALAVLPGGDVIVGGTFTRVGSVNASYLARYNQATNTWSALGSGTSNVVSALAVLPGGDLIVGGWFFTAGGVQASRIARYNPTTGVWTALGSGVNNTVRSLAVLPSGDVIVGGNFTIAGGVPVNQIARYNPTTGTWSSLGTGVTGVNTYVYALAVQPDGDVLVGGNFSNAGGVSANRIARYNPATGVWSALGSGVNNAVETFVFLPSGDVIVGGSFTFAGGVLASRIARYNPSTGVWSALGSGTNDDVHALAVLPGGDVIVGGRFTTAGGVSGRNTIARYNPSTGVWSALGSGTDGRVYALAVLPGGDVIVGGIFTTAGGVSVSSVARFDPAINKWSALGSGVDGVVGGLSNGIRALAVLPGGDMFVGGDFTTAGGMPANRVARYNPATGTWSALGGGVNSAVRSLAVLPGRDLIVGGDFTIAGGVLVNRIARYNPTTGLWSALGSGVNGTVYALLVLPSGDVIVGGNFTTAGGMPANRIARYNPASGTWSALGSGVEYTFNSPIPAVRALAILPNGDVIVGGSFNTAGGVPVGSIARYNPNTNTWSALGSGESYENTFYSLAVLPDGDVIAGGTFVVVDGRYAKNIARYNPATNTWSALGSWVDISGIPTYVYSLAVLQSGDLIVGGSFITIGGVSAINIARYNPATGVWSTLGTGTEFGSYVFALAQLLGGDMIVGGTFRVAGEYSTKYLARYTFGTPAPTIATHPVPQSACTAGSATFAVTPAGTGPFTYQWRKGAVAINTTTNPSAATGTLTLANVQAGDAGSYDCVVSTPCGSVTSTAVSLTVASCACGLSDVAGPGQSVGSDNALTADDIIVYLNWFFAGDTRADVAGPGQSTTPDTQFTADDIIVFLNRFFAGC
ncbi:MAG: GC-type dockerin domain-anchored protein [bacterium]